MKRAGLAAAVLAAGVLSLAAGCGGSAPAHVAASRPSSAPPSAAPSPSSAALSCTDISDDLHTVLHDLKTEDAAEQEAWVTGGDSSDLQTLIDDTDGAGGGTTLAADAQQFNTDASGYLADNSPELAPGWEDGYHQVRQDINALAGDCGLQGVPAPPGTS
jgi:hypothetical protein